LWLRREGKGARGRAGAEFLFGRWKHESQGREDETQDETDGQGDPEDEARDDPGLIVHDTLGDDAGSGRQGHAKGNRPANENDFGTVHIPLHQEDASGSILQGPGDVIEGVGIVLQLDIAAGVGGAEAEIDGSAAIGKRDEYPDHLGVIDGNIKHTDGGVIEAAGGEFRLPGIEEDPRERAKRGKETDDGKREKEKAGLAAFGHVEAPHEVNLFRGQARPTSRAEGMSRGKGRLVRGTRESPADARAL
jgi:hypothetical protein